MHKISSVFMLLLSLFIMTATLYSVELNWEHNYNKALEQAQKENKLVYLFIGADKCRFCKKFKKMTLSKDEVIQTMKKNFVLLYMSRDQHKIPDKFEIFGVPRHYFLTSGGIIIRTEQGIWDDTGWYSILDEVISEKDDFTTP
jgi:thioredoxin-related protein